MLKISLIENETRRQLVLEGKLIAPWTDELNRLSDATADRPDHKELVVDVSGLTVIGAEGERALLKLIAQGAKFRGGGVFVKQVLKQLARHGALQ